MILHIESPKTTHKNQLEKNKQSKVVGHKINIQKPVVFLYTNNGISEKEIKKQLHLQLQQKG